MSLADDLKLERDKINQCLVCVWLESMDDQDRLAVDDWIREGLPQKTLLRICQSNGLQVKQTAFRNHWHECVLKDSSCR